MCRSAKKEKRGKETLGFVCVHKRCESLTLGLVYILEFSWMTSWSGFGSPLTLVDRPRSPRRVSRSFLTPSYTLVLFLSLLIIVSDWSQTVNLIDQVMVNQVKRLKPMLRGSIVFPRVVMSRRGVMVIQTDL